MSIVDDLIRREGSTYTNHPADLGGPTKYGITQATLAAWRKHAVLPIDVEQLSEQEARDIYRVEFVAPWGFVSSPRLREFLIDAGVNHGLDRARKILQRALGVTEDGDIGTETRTALAGIDGETLRLRAIAERIRFYGHIVNRDHSQVVFIEGWLSRMVEFLY